MTHDRFTRRQAIGTAGLALLGGAAAAVGVPGTAAASPAPRLSLQQRVGERLIYSYSGLTPPSALFDRISAGRAAGVIFFGENISGLDQIADVVRQLRAANANSPVKAPLLLMTDQEGGRVRRLPGAPTWSEKEIGASADPSGGASAAGTGAGQNLAGVGMNVNLAPVLDVYREAGDFDDQYGRSYSTDPSVVAAAGRAFITAQQRTGVAAAAKHFPGLGSASATENTDVKPVTLTASLSTLRTVDEKPFAAAISARVKLVMLSWAVYPALDPNRPAGLSSAVIRGELRSRLGFTGVTITDALEAGALGAYGGTGPRAVTAAGAGMDLILCSARNLDQGDEAARALIGAVQGGDLNYATFTAAANRVTALRTTLS